jgi:hypothetical protein
MHSGDHVVGITVTAGLLPTVIALVPSAPGIAWRWIGSFVGDVETGASLTVASASPT